MMFRKCLILLKIKYAAKISSSILKRKSSKNTASFLQKNRRKPRSGDDHKKKPLRYLKGFFVIRLGLEPKTPALKVLCSTN